MNKIASEAAEYADVLRDLLPHMGKADSIQVFVIPPFTSIAAVKQRSGGRFWVGAQNMHWEESGPYTGEISAGMLAELGVDLVQLGHAERRTAFNETDIAVNQKVHAALRVGLRPLVCVGEELADREFNVEREICARQLRIALKDVPLSSADQLIIGYEPVWAIGDNGKSADPLYIREMRGLFQSLLADMFGSDWAKRIPILYGGSVDATNAPALLIQGQVDGLFVGRAALDPTAFAAVITSCLSALEEIE
jgi:triosephosphate isomerase